MALSARTGRPRQFFETWAAPRSCSDGAAFFDDTTRFALFHGHDEHQETGIQ